MPWGPAVYEKLDAPIRSRASRWVGRQLCKRRAEFLEFHPTLLLGRRFQAIDVTIGGVFDFVLHWFLWLVTPATTLSLRLGLTPDFYNFAGLGFGVVSGLALAGGESEIAGWMLVLSGVCDILDGRIARAMAVTSRYGAFIDSMLDRFIELAFFLGFAWFLRGSPHGALAATLALGGSVLVSYARSVGESLSVECTRNMRDVSPNSLAMGSLSGGRRDSGKAPSR